MIQYAVTNEKVRITFEKKYHLPYGYGNAFITTSLKSAMEFLNNVPTYVRPECIIEKIDCGVVEIVYPEDRKLYYVEVDSANA